MVTLLHHVRNLWARTSLRRQGVLIITVPVVCLLLFLGASVYLRYYTVAATRYVTHTQEVLLESNNLLVALLNAETGVRGYDRTLSKNFLEPYNMALEALPLSVNRLSNLVQDNPRQVQQIQVIAQGIQRELDLLLEGINNVDASISGTDISASQRTLFIRQKAVMDQLRADINQFQLEEQRLLLLREQLADEQEQLRGWTQLAMTAVSVLASVAAICLFDRIERERQLGIKKLQLQAQDAVHFNEILSQTNMMLADRNQELDQFAYVSSHDLKAPLRAIANLSEWIEEDLEGQLSAEGQQYMNLLRKRVQRMDTLINGLLEYSRMGRAKVSIETVNVADLLAEVIDLLAPPPTFVIKVGLMPTMQTRRLLLSQVFSNLISNAIKHCDRFDGLIKITVNVQNELCEFAVSDNGPGIAPEYHNKIFAIFQTLEARDKTENTGIGLSIVKKLVESEGGKVWVESKLGEGATFLFTWHILPADQQPFRRYTKGDTLDSFCNKG
jgi:signal transduction histidine kinase